MLGPVVPALYAKYLDKCTFRLPFCEIKTKAPYISRLLP
jgi:hypothetical protein